MFGAVLGGVNGYLVAGSVLYYNHVANYPTARSFLRLQTSAIIAAIDRLMAVMPRAFWQNRRSILQSSSFDLYYCGVYLIK